MAPVPELLSVWRVGDPPEVGAVGSGREDVLLVAGALQGHGKHDPLAVGRPSRMEREGAAGTGVLQDAPESAAIRADDVELSSGLGEQDPPTVGGTSSPNNKTASVSLVIALVEPPPESKGPLR